MAFAPENVNHGIEEQFEDAGGDDAADHRGSDAFHYIGPALIGGRPHDREEAEHDSADGHDFGSDPLDRAFDDCSLQIVHGIHFAGGAEFVPGVVEIEEHDNAGFSVEA